jgi:ankyrin repeat protein
LIILFLINATPTMALLHNILEEQDQYGMTPLHLAVKNEEIQFIKFLLKASSKAGFDIVNTRTDRDETPIHFVLGGDHSYQMLTLLIENGADIENKDCYGHTILIKSV